MKHLNTDSRYKPDIKISYEYKDRQELDSCIVEVKKKSDVSYSPNNSDCIKIHLEMKLMLDKMIKMNIDQPFVYGLQVEGFNCQVIRMSLDSDGFYFSLVYYFHLPRDILDIMMVPKVASVYLIEKRT